MYRRLSCDWWIESSYLLTQYVPRQLQYFRLHLICLENSRDGQKAGHRLQTHTNSACHIKPGKYISKNIRKRIFVSERHPRRCSQSYAYDHLSADDLIYHEHSRDGQKAGHRLQTHTNSACHVKPGKYISKNIRKRIFVSVPNPRRCTCQQMTQRTVIG